MTTIEQALANPPTYAFHANPANDNEEDIGQIDDPHQYLLFSEVEELT